MNRDIQIQVSSNMVYIRQSGEWASVQRPSRKQWIRSWFMQCCSITRCAVFTHSLLWHRWLTSPSTSRNWDLVRPLSTISATRWAFSSFLPSTGHLTDWSPYPLYDTLPVHRTQEFSPGWCLLFFFNLNWRSRKNASINACYILSVPIKWQSEINGMIASNQNSFPTF